MAILRIDEIRKMPQDQRVTKLGELRAELSKLMATKAMGGSLENPARIRLLRKTIARILTVNREEEIGKAKPAAAKQKAEEQKPEEAAPAEKAAEEKPKAKRGRKPKAKPAELPKEGEAAPAEAPLAEKAAEEKPKAKRGRKPKAKPPEVAEAAAPEGGKEE
uniref:Large ribosomal subunit protein uL29 n=1 Tax=Candidatus Methanomethylicus mesodigestus TaxID=1867258 RepID=A0A7C3ERX3_9CREN